MEYCSKCRNVMNGFDYGYGVNPICETCNDKDRLNKLQIEYLEKIIKP